MNDFLELGKQVAVFFAMLEFSFGLGVADVVEMSAVVFLFSFPTSVLLIRYRYYPVYRATQSRHLLELHAS